MATPVARTLNDTGHYESRRRMLRTVGILGGCEGEDMYSCPYGGMCVPVQDRDQCPLDPDPNPSLLTTVQAGLHEATFINVDTRGFFDRVIECYGYVLDHPEARPTALKNQRDDCKDCVFCPMMWPTNSIRLPAVNPQGIRTFVESACQTYNGTEAIDNCICPWYYQTDQGWDTVAFSLVPLSVTNTILNGLMSLQFYGWQLIWQWFPFVLVHEIWAGFFGLAGKGAFPPGLVFVFSDFGLSAVPIGTRWLCAGVHSGSLFGFLLMLVILFGVAMAAMVFPQWAKGLRGWQVMKKRTINRMAQHKEKRG